MLYGSKLLRGRDWGPYNAVSWDMIEKSSLRSGIPSYLRTAILLKRSNDEIFSFGMNIKTDVSGFSFRSLQDGLLESDDDPIIFDPGASPLWAEDLPHLGGFDLANLGSVDLSSFLEVKLEVLTSENIQQNEMIEHEIMEGLEAFVQPSQVEESSSESWFVNLWDTDPGPDKWESLPPSLERKDLEKMCDQQRRPKGPRFLSNSRTNNQGVLTFVTSYDFLLSRRHDRGSCQVFNSRDGSKVLKEYIIQTPFYSSGFWSLLLYSVTDSEIPGSMSKLSGVIQADNDVELPRIFRDVHRLVDRHGHHEMLLPLQLFKTHYETTSKSFKSILADVAEVDKELLQQLEAEDKQNEVSGLYNKLSMTLHKCSMQLADSKMTLGPVYKKICRMIGS
ncbi:hypothetical protein EDB81DRAFT_757792 [Dactylonectria macrodidyma]|uniref:Uncharacterized protein n=1 Tax=Dactylonectria macrodidyma TaxID=307937 RepID=A0A9P9F5N4_9HYPO|nr:hypothetical protein EDB81DRAFT_757792 [Dactylonectria macrodidyma]